MLHGVLLIALFSCAAFYIGEMSFVRSLSFSPMIVGIILGMLYANSLRNNLPETWVPGIQFQLVHTFMAGELEWNPKEWGPVELPRTKLVEQESKA